ncbi:peptidylprolyl isomerase [uncultured Desulfobacter sp.]|uniref:peptidylprolyl isomerase n=1 Tax=uncultured Desulfobacter sp. TaxID=240139 RepID=UPI0029F4E9A4|nr:peptidylprolyl isomerase [uncultured Desulfobacter sp.]
MQKIIMPVLLTLVCGFIFGACTPDNQNPSVQPLAVVDGRAITTDMFITEMAESRIDFSDFDGKRQLLDTMVHRETLCRQAEKLGYLERPEIIRRIAALIAEQFRQDHLTPVLNQIIITERDIQSHYEAHKQKFFTQEMLRPAVIHLRLPPNASEQKKIILKEKAEHIMMEALELPFETPGFGALAVKYSDDQASRYKGGDKGWIQRTVVETQWDQAVAKALFSIARPGCLSPVIEGDKGYYLLKLVDKKERRPIPIKSVRDRIKHELMVSRRRQAEQQFLAELKADVGVTVNYDAINTIKLSQAENTQKTLPTVPDI